MGKSSQIQWTDATWNVARGCRKVDEDCKFCYMYRDSFNGTRYNPREVVRTKTVFDMPLQYHRLHSDCWPGKPLIFTCSLTDFFLPEVDAYRDECWDIIRKCPHLIFQILTKRPERIPECLPPDWGELGYKNVWLGTSVGSQAGEQRIRDLVKVPAAVSFLSLEPLHGPIDLMSITDRYADIDLHVLSAIDWVIVGGESGHDTGKYRYRPCTLEWIEQIVNFCQFNYIPVFVKQMGTHLAKQLKMSDRHGGNIEEFPEYLRVREFPKVR